MTQTADSNAVCVYCSSSNAVDPAYFAVARELGEALGARGKTLVYGGASVGLMGAVAEAAQAAGARVVGVLPRPFADRELAYEAADELILTDDLRERKAIMEARAGAFIALPGGLGTLEEALEALTLKQIGLLDKPFAFINHEGFYNPLFAIFQEMYARNFAKPWLEDLYHNCPDAAAALDAIAQPNPPPQGLKWFD